MSLSLKRLLNAGLSFVIVSLIGSLGFYLFVLLFVRLGGLDNNLKAAIIAAGAALFSVLYNSNRQKKRELDEAHRPEKMKVYSKFLEFNFDLLKRTSRSESLDQQGIADLMLDFTRDVIFWGSPSVLRAYQQFRMVGQRGAAAKEVILAVDGVLRAFRKDLGHSNFGLKPGDLFRLILKDPAELDL